MRETRITLPELALIAGTRAALGAGLGLLLADRLSDERRKGIGWTLVAIGAISTIPLAFEVLGRGRFTSRNEWTDELESAASSDQYDPHAPRATPARADLRADVR